MCIITNMLTKKFGIDASPKTKERGGTLRHSPHPNADGAADTFGGRTSALPLILRRHKYKYFFVRV